MLRKRGLYTAGSRLDAFRHVSRVSSEEKDHHVIVNCLRRAIRQERGGHISRLAAYDADTDRFLILNVSRYKYLLYPRVGGSRGYVFHDEHHRPR